MHLFFLLSTLLILSACSTTPEISSSNENSTAQKIQSNHSAAAHAQDEYKKLQAQRDKE
jgi:starvation-inducible outer membrane lipoprotein